MKPCKNSTSWVLSSLLSWSIRARAVDCNVSSYVVNTQDDATALNECASKDVSFNGNVTIGPKATGFIVFRNLGLVNGSIIAENNAGLTSLSFENDDPKFNLNEWIQEIVLRNLSALSSMSFPYVVTTPGSIVFDNLPSLETVNLSSLYLVQDTRLKDLPRLRTFLVSPVAFGTAGDIEVKNVGLSSLDEIFRIGFGVDDVSVDGIPNVKSLAYSLSEAKNVSIHGNGDLAVSFDCTACTVMTNPERKENATSIEISGASSVSRNATTDGEVLEFVVDTFTATHNALDSLPIDFTNLSSLYVIDNANLTTMWFNANFTKYSWRDIVISGNPKLRFNSTTEIPKALRVPLLDSTWVWPSVDVSSMTFEGPFDNAFFQPFIDLGQDKSQRPRVLQKFVVASSLGTDQFNCTGLDSLRKAGVLAGEYSCQNQTVKDKSDKSGAPRSRLVADLSLSLLVIGLNVLFCNFVIV